MKKTHVPYTIFLYAMSLVLTFTLYLSFHNGMVIHVLLDSFGKLVITLSTTFLVLQSSLLFIEITFPILVAMTFLSSFPCIEFMILTSYKSYPRFELGIAISIVVLGYFLILKSKRNFKLAK
ncbi:MAG: hypothetical protein ACRCVV_09260 [Shewanella sp.]